MSDYQEEVDTETGEVVKPVQTIEAIPEKPQVPKAAIQPFAGGTAMPDLYKGAGQGSLDDISQKILTDPIPTEALDIKPTGEVYLTQIEYRRRLNLAFGVGRWAMIPIGERKRIGSTVCQDWALVANGQFLAQAMGEQDYVESNKNMTLATAVEGAKSNALTRCCKDLGIAAECWDKRFCEKFKKENCVSVWNPKANKYNWRRKDTPFWWEGKGEAADGNAGNDAGAPNPPAGAAGGGYGREAGPARTQAPGSRVSDAQIKRMFALMHKAGLTVDQVDAYTASLGIQSKNDMTRAQYDKVCGWIERGGDEGEV